MNNTQNKFGAFTGVFTPSILTILGVIMYMRLGWVVGEAGLLTAIAIIIIAHVISVTTGLSISSIATDKKIRTGGIYYILSRSLGLPMGGAIGITLFVGTALSISLYIVGFAENFLGIESIRNFLGLGTGINDIRILGTAVITILVIIAFISTSLVMKMQYVVLSAIGLSLVSIVAGLVFNTSFHTEQIALLPLSGGVSPAVIFGVFFPAVTGFTVGVSMSGDLKDPNRSIPKGTMGAIITGLIVYLLLAIVFGIYLDRQMLVGDKNFLMKVALFSPLVVAGIWGATLSSALGGILGAPRIMQAIAADRLMPKFLKKGYGPANEPRNALLLTFLIAEAGILIGDLNIIAGIVSMFYISAYGFINLAYALERWASSDFRPTFSIPVWVGVLGAVASFAVMFKLDTLAMIIALLIMFAIYAILKRRQLQLDFGDVWQSVWSTMVRDSLHRMDLKQLELRNWRPNIILFSGNKGVRDHLISFGKALVGKHGFLSDFELIEQRDKSTVLPKPQQSVKTTGSEEETGVFSRREYSDDIYRSIVSISKHYGFAGVEPNTILLGWGRHSNDPGRFADTIRQLTRLDLNIMMMDFDQKKGFGDRKRIDIWWRGSNNNGQLALSLVRFLWLSDEWRNAEVRLMVVNYNNDRKKHIERKAKDILSTMRLKATLKIINNGITERPFTDIIQAESVATDITFLGIPEIEQGEEEQFVEKVNSLCTNINTVVLLRASSTFKAIDIGVDSSPEKIAEKIDPVLMNTRDEYTGFNLQHYEPELAAKQTMSELMDISGYVCEELLHRMFSYQDEFLQKYREETDKFLDDYAKDKTLSQQAIHQQYHQYLAAIESAIEKYRVNYTDIQRDFLDEISSYIEQRILELIRHQPHQITIERLPEEFDPSENDTINRKIYKGYIKFINRNKKTIRERIAFRKLINHLLLPHQQKVINRLIEKWLEFSMQYQFDLMKLIQEGNEIFLTAERQSQVDSERDGALKSRIISKIEDVHQHNRDAYEKLSELFRKEMGAIATKLQEILQDININSRIPNLPEKQMTQERSKMESLPENWKNNQQLMLNVLFLEVIFHDFASKIRAILQQTKDELNETINTNFAESFGKLLKLLSKKNIKNEELKLLLEKQSFSAGQVKVELRNVIDNTLHRIRQIENKFPEVMQIMSETDYLRISGISGQGIQKVDVLVRQLADYLIQKNLAAPLQKKLLETARHIDEIASRSQEYVKRLSFELISEEDSQQEIINKKQLVEDTQHMHKNLQEELEKILEQETLLSAFIDGLKKSINDDLTIDSFMRSIKEMQQYVKTREQKQRMNKARELVDTSLNNFKYFLNQFWYLRSKAVIRKNQRAALPAQARIEDFLNLRKAVAPNKEKLHMVPFYYQQLFSRKQYYLHELWTDRSVEINKGKDAYADFLAGYHGGMLVYGERGSGKSFFSQYLSKELCQQGNVFTVYAPYSGATSTALFKTNLQKATDIYGSYDEIFNKIPSNSIIIIDDLELWWENIENGYKVIDQVAFLMERYSNRCFFIITMNNTAYKHLQAKRKIASLFLKMIELQPFDAETLKEAILKRHLSSDFSYKIVGQKSIHTKAWQQARMFHQLFEYSGGNIGVALRSWLKSIISVESQTLLIQPLKRPDTDLIRNIDKDWLLLIHQLLLHKRLTLTKLVRISGESQSKIIKKINMLKRAGLLQEQNDGVFEIDAHMYPWINKVIYK